MSVFGGRNIWLEYAGDRASVRSEAFDPQGFKCISIKGDSNGGSTTVRSRGGVLSREGPFFTV